MKFYHRILLSVSSGLLLSFGWYEWGTGLVLLVGLIPLLIIEENLTSGNVKSPNSSIFLYASVAMLSWNLFATWWIKNASFAGLMAAVLVSSFYMAITFVLYSAVKRRAGRVPGYVSLVIFWLAFEFAYLHGEISWPWLTLGNGFMFDLKLIQWYEYTGILGGSLWVLIVNILIFELIRRKIDGESFRRLRLPISICTLIIVLPVTISIIRYYTYHETPDSHEIVVVQPNIDPYLKFNDVPPLEQTQIQISEAAKMVTPSTDYVVCPETSIMDNIWIGEFEFVPDLKMVKEFVLAHPAVHYITGIMCYQKYSASERTRTSNPIGNSGFFYDSYNSAIQIDTTDSIPIYHKSKLVIGVEKMPYPEYFKILEPLTLQLGGTFRSHAIQEEREVFTAHRIDTKIAPVICYESVYGEFVGNYIKKGANYIFVITNDGWWGNTPGHRQHNAISSLRAIETRRSIARSANTGISCFINQRGDVLQSIIWWKRGAIRENLNANNTLTFYTKHGDYIGRFAFYPAILLIVLLLLIRVQVLLGNKIRSGSRKHAGN